MQFALTAQKILSRLTMAEVEALLPVDDFIRIHRSYLVAKSRVTKIDKSNVWVGSILLPVGPAYAGEVEKLVR